MRRTLTPAVVAAVATVLVVTLPAPAATAAPRPYLGANTAAVQDDFNGDGYRDTAVGAPGARVGGQEAAGAVVVLYGGRGGVSTARRVVITQNTAGVPGSAEQADGFGTAVDTADLDRDGYADLIVGASWETVGTMEGQGSVTVVWGGPNGLSGGASVAPPTGLREWTAFGDVLKAADVTGDGYPDLAAASNDGAIAFTGPFTRTGAYASRRFVGPLGSTWGVTAGDLDGDGVAERVWLPGPSGGNANGDVWIEDGSGAATELPGAAGMVGVVADVDGDGYGDLVLGLPFDASVSGDADRAAHEGGEVDVWYGGPEGVDPAQTPRALHQDSAGVPGGGEDGDLFGNALSADDVNGDGFADVLVGVPGEKVGPDAGAGGVVLLRGSAAGLGGAGAAAYHQDLPEIAGGAERADDFGRAVHLADLDADRRPDVLVGVPGENAEGGVWFARGAASGPVLNGSVAVSSAQAGLAAGGVPDDFGSSVNGPRSPL
ncbi:FG-GAP-like repeat-containing protein [Streptomyces sp. NPDC049881]|uniref:FG-GAP-like repeat-containing protein n=1 Tax=Streptomyces sp. NPDC049881 TaxID=3155778 RepID=UPI00343D8483